MKKKTFSLPVLLILLSNQASYGVFPLLVETDGTGAFLDGSYNGDGSVQANVEAGDFNANGPNSQVLVDGATSGTLGFDIDVAGGTRVSNTLAGTFQFSFSGGSGDLELANSTQFDGANDKFNSIGLSGLAGVTAISVTMSLNEYVAGRDSDLPNIGSRPVLGALGLASIGQGLTLNSFNVDMSYTNAGFASDSMTFEGGGPGVPSYRSAQWATEGSDGLDHSADGFAGLVGPGLPTENFLVVRGFDFDDPADGYDAADADKFYAKSQTWTITPRNAASFSEGTAFVFSMDGKQHSNLNLVVPEPSTSLLGLIAGLLAICHRRREGSLKNL